MVAVMVMSIMSLNFLSINSFSSEFEALGQANILTSGVSTEIMEKQTATPVVVLAVVAIVLVQNCTITALGSGEEADKLASTEVSMSLLD